MRSPLPRRFLTRLETGRLVLYSLLTGGLVGLLGSGWRLVLDAALNLSAGLLGYRPPGTAGEGGLLMAFGDGLPTLLLLLPVVAALMAWLNSSGRDPLDSVVSGYHARGEWQGAPAGLRTLLGQLIGTGSGLLISRDSSFTALGSLAATLLSRLARLDAAERRTLTLASVAAALGVALHAPLAAAVLMAEVLYRRFEFEFEVVMPCVLSAVSASAAYGLIWGFDPLFSLPGPFSLNLGQLPLALLLALGVTGLSWLLARAARLLPALPGGWLRPLLAAGFGLLTGVIAVYSTPAVLGDGSGWLQLALSGFVGQDGGGVAAWRWLLMALGLRLAFGGGVLVSASTGGLLGVGLASLLPSLGLQLDLPVAALVGAACCLTVTLNIPLAAALLAVTWGGEGLLPAVLASAALAHFISGEASVLPGQVPGRADSRVHLPLGTTVLGRTGAALRPPPAAPALGPARSPATASGTAEPAAGSQGESFAARGTASQEPPSGSAPQLYRQPVPRSWLGARLGLLSLPETLRLLGVVREGQALLGTPELRLMAGDELLLLAPPAEYARWQQSLLLPAPG